MSARIWLYVEAVLVVVSTLAVLAAPFVVVATLRQDPPGLLLVGFFGGLAGYCLAICPFALYAIRRDLRRLQ